MARGGKGGCVGGRNRVSQRHELGWRDALWRRFVTLSIHVAHNTSHKGSRKISRGRISDGAGGRRGIAAYEHDVFAVRPLPGAGRRLTSLVAAPLGRDCKRVKKELETRAKPSLIVILVRFPSHVQK